MVPQLSGCLGFEAVWGVLNWSGDSDWARAYSRAHACIVVLGVAGHDHLID